LTLVDYNASHIFTIIVSSFFIASYEKVAYLS